MSLIYDDLILLFGVTGLKRLVHLESPEDDSLLQGRIENWLSISEKTVYGLVGFSSASAPQWIIDSVSGILLALLRYNLIPSEPNRLQYELLSNQLIKTVEYRERIGYPVDPVSPEPGEISGVYIFVV